VILVGLHLAVVVLSPRLGYGSAYLSGSIFTLTGIVILSGLIYLHAVLTPSAGPLQRALFAWVLIVGAALRISMFFSTPMLEDDYYRYLWDGGVTAGALNPFAWSPDEVRDESDDAEQIPESLRILADESGSTIKRINHPHLRTIYPPVAQAVFAMAHMAGPWSLLSWRLTLLFFDAITLWLIIVILRRLHLPLISIAVYWWNPLLMKEVFNSGHMDLLVLPFLLGAILLEATDRHIPAFIALALATGVKLWPVILLPLFLRSAARHPGRRTGALLSFVVLAALMSLPVLRAGLGTTSGFTAYGEQWEMNDALFMVFQWSLDAALNLTGIFAGAAGTGARLLAFLVLAGWTWRVTFRSGSLDLSALCRRSLLITAALFLLSPTQFPWYYLWLLPFLAIQPRGSLLLLTALLPLYYLRFYFKAVGDVGTFDNGIVWLEYAPVWLLLAREWYMGRSESIQASAVV